MKSRATDTGGWTTSTRMRVQDIAARGVLPSSAMLTEEAHAAGVADQRLAGHEQAAHEKRNWVRLTFDCNNRCVFCLDSDTHDGRMRDREEVARQIVDGRRA